MPATLCAFDRLPLPDSPAPPGRGMPQRRSRSELVAETRTAAYDLLAEGKNPSVRAVRSRTGGSTNEVAAALADWRASLKSKIDGAIAEQGFPDYVAEYVRVGIRTAQLLRTREEAEGTDTVEALLKKNAALEASVALVEQERTDLRSRIARLEGDLTAARRLADDREQARSAFTTALSAADALRAELTEARSRAGRVKGLETQLEDARAALGRAHGEVAELRETAAALRAALHEARAAAVRSGLLERQIEDLNAALASAQEEITTLVRSTNRRRPPTRATPRTSKRPPRTPSTRAGARPSVRKQARAAPVAKRSKPMVAKRPRTGAPRGGSSRGRPKRGSRR